MGSGREAAWPLLRSDLSFSYVQIGILVSLPGIVSSLIGPVFGILADVGRRRALILGGGVACALAMTLSAISQSFWSLLVSFILLHPASGAFVCLSQVALMDHDPERREQNMARWTLAGSLGVVGGPLAIGAGTALGIGWRGLFLVFAGLTALLVAAAWRYPFPNSNGQREPEEALTFCDGLRNAWQALRLFEVRRWLVLLQFSDFMLDILYCFLALYFVDVVGISVGKAALAVTIWTTAGLVGNFLLLPLLERVRGLSYLRVSAVIVLFLFPSFLLVPALGPKLVLLGLLGLLNSGWYAILQAQLYASMPGQGGAALAVGSVVMLFTSITVLIIGAVAQAAGLGTAMWLLLAGPLVLAAGLPRRAAEVAAEK